ncbi:YceI family protein [Eisenibacter elegans]|jgi:polyisoprenoid-binding protein YceI|uniref:YceI family protein n=1 Tax=Eisenibacter elegans TaxID=997 RepID=UPI0004201BA6|nr:YceI family protein [Eisenibacter elegans]
MQTTAQTTWKVKQSSVTFHIRNAGLRVEGSFSNLKAQLSFEPSQLAQSTIEASIPSNTINTGIAMRDKHLRAADYFDVDKYPTITMKSQSFKALGGQKYSGVFTLTLKGTSKTVTLPFSFRPQEKVAVFEGELTLNRRDYNIGGSSLTLSNDLTVFIRIEAEK